MIRKTMVLMPVLIVIFFLFSCASATKTTKLTEINIGMNKNEVKKALGEPTAARGAIQNKYGEIVEVWEYRLAKPKTSRQVAGAATVTLLTLGLASPMLFADGDLENYWLYFYENKLIQWGQAGDWKTEADRIYEVRFGDSKQLTR